MLYFFTSNIYIYTILQFLFEFNHIVFHGGFFPVKIKLILIITLKLDL